MFGLVVAMAALAAPVSGPGLATKVASSVSEDVLDSDLVGMWYFAFVSPEGTIEKCTVLATLGDGEAAKKVCNEIVGQHVKPAVGLQGRPAYGSFIGSISLAENVDRLPADTLAPDLTIRSRALSGGKDGRVALNVAIGADGKVLACERSDGSDELSRMACAEVSRLDFSVEKAKDGRAVAYLRPIIVKFEAEQG